MEKKQEKAILNDFEKKTVLNALKEHGIVDLLSYVAGSKQVYYCVLYKYNDFIFASNVLYSNNLYADNKPSVVDFIKDVCKSVRLNVESFNDFTTAKNHPSKSEIKNTSYSLYILIDNVYCNLTNPSLIEECVDYIEFYKVEENCYQLLDIGLSCEEVIDKVLAKYNMRSEYILDRLKTYKHDRAYYELINKIEKQL